MCDWLQEIACSYSKTYNYWAIKPPSAAEGTSVHVCVAIKQFWLYRKSMLTIYAFY